MESKQCTKCKVSKPITDFGKHKTGRLRLHGRCKLCRNAEGRQYKANNYEKNKEGLSDVYLKQLLSRRSNLCPKEIPKELAEVKRLELLIRRNIKELSK